MNGDDASFPLPALTVRQLITATLVVALVILGFWLLFRFYEVVLILIAGVIISTALRPAVRRMRSYGIPSGLGVLLIYALLLVFLGATVRFGAPLITRQVSTIGEVVEEGYVTFRRVVVESSSLLLGRFGATLPEELPATVPAEPVEEEPPPVVEEPATGIASTDMGQATLFIGQLFRSVIGVIAIFLFGYFWTIESERVKRSFYLLLPARHRDSARELVAGIEEQITNFVTGQLFLVLIIGVVSYIAYLLIGLPNALVLAIFAGVMEAVPMVGPLIGAIPAFFVAFTESPTDAIWVAVATVIIQQLENHLLVPRVMRRTLNIRPLVTLLALIAFSSLFGVIGALIALPLAAVIQLLLERSILNSELEQESSSGRDKTTRLRYETQELVKDIRNVFRAKGDVTDAADDQIEDSIEAIALDLDSMLAQYSNGNGNGTANGRQRQEAEAAV